MEEKTTIKEKRNKFYFPKSIEHEHRFECGANDQMKSPENGLDGKNQEGENHAF